MRFSYACDLGMLSTDYQLDMTKTNNMKFKLTLAWMFLTILFSLPMSALAVLQTINNSSFETPNADPGEFIVDDAAGPLGWSVYNTGATTTNQSRSFGVWNPTGTNSYGGDDAPHLNNIGVVFLSNTSNIAEAGLEQVLTSTLQMSTFYTLTVEVGNFAGSIGSFNFTGFPGYRVDLLAGSTVIASDNNTLTPGEGIFETSVVTFETGSNHTNAGEALSIRLVNLNGAGIEVNFDNVRLDASPVPEPSTAFLGALGMIFGCFKRHR